MIKPVLKVEDLHIVVKGLNGTEKLIVKGINFEVQPGQVVALIGESGSGKTSIALAALGYCRPGLEFAGGKIEFKGVDLISTSRLERRALRGHKIAYLAQSAAATFNPSIRIGDQVTESAVLHNVLSQKEADNKAVLLYHDLELPKAETIGQRYPHQVSGGQLQRLMAAMALCSGPELMLLDEPTTALDVTTQIEVLKSFKSLIREKGTSAIYVTHDLAVVAQIADHIIVLCDGEIMESGPTDQIIHHPAHAYTRKLMAAVNPIPTDKREIKISDKQGRLTLEVEALYAGYGQIQNGRPEIPVLQDITFSLPSGSTTAIIGESGCGKSTLGLSIAGILPRASGNVRLDGKNLPARLEVRSRENLKHIQFVFQMADTALNPRQRVSDIIGRPLRFYKKMNRIDVRNRVLEILEMVDLSPELVTRYPKELSGGQKQRVNLARALAADPEILICDEVTSALDTIVGANIISLLSRLRSKLGVSFIFISHDISTVATFANQIIVLYAGIIVEQGPADLVLSPPYHPYTKLLLASVPELRTDWLDDTVQLQETKAAIARQVEINETGCPFYTRCPFAISGTCNESLPPVRDLGAQHSVTCHLDGLALPGNNDPYQQRVG